MISSSSRAVIMNMLRAAYESDAPVKTLKQLIAPYSNNDPLLATAIAEYAPNPAATANDNDKGWFVFCATALCHLYYVPAAAGKLCLCPRSQPVFYVPGNIAVPYAWLTCDNMGMLHVVQQHRMPPATVVTVHRRMGQYELAPLQLEELFPGTPSREEPGGGGPPLLSFTVHIVESGAAESLDIRLVHAVNKTSLPIMLLFTATTHHAMIRLMCITPSNAPGGGALDQVPAERIKYVRSPMVSDDE